MKWTRFWRRYFTRVIASSLGPFWPRRSTNRMLSCSNIAHQGAKLDGERRDELIARIRHIEFELYGLPHPDLVLLLDLPAGEAGRLIAKKQARSYTDKKADLQEADGGYLARVRDVYRQLAAEDPGWVTIDCLSDGQLRSIEEIGEDVTRAVQDRRTK